MGGAEGRGGRKREGSSAVEARGLGILPEGVYVLDYSRTSRGWVFGPQHSSRVYTKTDAIRIPTSK